MYERAVADKGIVPLSYRRREYARALPFAERAVASAQASEQRPRQQRAEHLRSAIRRMYERAVADKGIVPLSYRRRSTPALCYLQNERSRPRKRRNNIPRQQRAERPRSAIRRTCGRVRASVGTTSPAAADGTPALCNSQSVRLFRRRTYSTARFASALPAAKGRRTPLPPFGLESPIYKSFRRKNLAPAFRTAIYHTRKHRRTAAVRLDRGAGTALLVFSPLLYLDTPGVTPPAENRCSVQELCRHTRRRSHPHGQRAPAARRESRIEVMTRPA